MSVRQSYQPIILHSTNPKLIHQIPNPASGEETPRQRVNDVHNDVNGSTMSTGQRVNYVYSSTGEWCQQRCLRVNDGDVIV